MSAARRTPSAPATPPNICCQAGSAACAAARHTWAPPRTASCAATPTTCFSRERYGTDTCAGERLRAGLLDQAVIDALLDTFQRTDLFEQAIAASRTQAETLRDQNQAELATVTAQIGKAEASIERYLDAFEAGSLSEDTCGQRVHKLGGMIAELRVRQDELRAALDAVNIQPPTRRQLADLA
jgi:site-specific DNA recombinase